MYLLRLMLVGVWLGLLWVLFYFFDHYIQSSLLDPLRSVQFSLVFGLDFIGYYLLSSIIVFIVQFSSVQCSAVQFTFRPTAFSSVRFGGIRLIRDSFTMHQPVWYGMV